MKNKRPCREELLSHVERRLSDTEIGKLYGVGKMAVYNWRRTYGIPSRHDLFRQALPELTQAQKDLILGGLLGDGEVDRTSSTKARYIDSHKNAHHSYVHWKAEQLAPYVSKVSTSDTMCTLYTISHDYMLGLYLDWYRMTDGKMQKQAPSEIHLSPSAIAVWFMDDGSKSDNTVRFHTGMNGVHLESILAAMREIGFHPTLYWSKNGSGKNVDVALPAEDMPLFRDMVDEYIHPIMRYKFPYSTSRQSVISNAKKLTHDVAVCLLDKNFSVPEIASLFGVSDSTVERRLTADPMYNMGRPKSATLHEQAADQEILQMGVPLYDSVPENDRHRWVDRVVNILQNTEFPHHRRPAFHYTKQQLQKLQNDVPDNMSYLGNDLCLAFMPHIHKVTKGNRPYSKSVFDSWSDPFQLREAVVLTWKAKPVTCAGVRQALSFTHRAPTNFRPVSAKNIIQRHCPDGGVVYDPCAGWGGRLLGFMASHATKYVGTDVEPDTIDGLKAIYETAKLHICHKDVHLEVRKAQVEYLVSDVDLVFTSPPYFNTEIYSSHPEQSCNEFTSYDSWVEGFLHPMIQNAYASLKESGEIVICVADVRAHGEEYRLVSNTAQVLEASGFHNIRSEEYLLQGRAKTARSETLLIATKAKVSKRVDPFSWAVP